MDRLTTDYKQVKWEWKSVPRKIVRNQFWLICFHHTMIWDQGCWVGQFSIMFILVNDTTDMKFGWYHWGFHQEIQPTIGDFSTISHTHSTLARLHSCVLILVGGNSYCWNYYMAIKNLVHANSNRSSIPFIATWSPKHLGELTHAHKIKFVLSRGCCNKSRG